MGNKISPKLVQAYNTVSITQSEVQTNKQPAKHTKICGAVAPKHEDDVPPTGYTASTSGTPSVSGTPNIENTVDKENANPIDSLTQEQIKILKDLENGAKEYCKYTKLYQTAKCKLKENEKITGEIGAYKIQVKVAEGQYKDINTNEIRALCIQDTNNYYKQNKEKIDKYIQAMEDFKSKLPSSWSFDNINGKLTIKYLGQEVQI